MDWTLVISGAALILNALVIGFWKPWLGAYGGEKGKNLARKEDLNEILAEVRSVTITQKEIESKLSGDLWDRQMLRTQKINLYGDLLKFSQELAYAFAEMTAVLKMREDIRPEFKAEGEKNLTNLLIIIRQSQIAFSKTVMLSLIFTMPECAELLTEFTKNRTPVESHTAEWASLEAEKFSTLWGTLVAMAKKDLGLLSMCSVAPTT